MFQTLFILALVLFYYFTQNIVFVSFLVIVGLLSGILKKLWEDLPPGEGRHRAEV